MRTKQIALVVTLLVIFVSGCASIPKESIALNQEIGRRITAMHQSNIELVNIYFESKMRKIDEFTEERVDDYTRSIGRQIEDGSTPPVDAAALLLIMEPVAKFYSEATEHKAELEKTKILILDRLNQNHMETLQGNRTITGLLQSHSEIEDAIKSGQRTLAEISGDKIDLLKIGEVIEGSFMRVGEMSADAADLYKRIERLLK